ncbi:amidase [Gordonia rubripertincta]|uniref:amidase n=1 Tax=Gordonia rubripertincta TaxID=36822 RepID=UPI0015F8809C|nr:amidase [Gordonia rubripertincta]QMU23168.1 amidase [Gordonia rubripertincta]
MGEYLGADATALAGLVASGEVTAAELLDLARARAAAVNPDLNAIVIPIEAEADHRARTELTGPFAGVPFLIKDLAQDYRGYPTTRGSRSLARHVATEHATVVQRFLDAGLVVFGKTNTPEFGSKAITESVLWGPARNPWNLDVTPGGSSGGSAAAVAAGVVPAAGANDGGGSIRIPAACTGLVGLKASRGLMPFGPATGEPLFGMGVEGVVTRTVRDAAALYDAIIGPTASSTYPAPLHTESFTTRIASPPRLLRIGYTTRSAINPAPHPEAVAAVEHAAKLLTELGHQVDEVDPPHDDAELARDFLEIWFAKAAAQVDEARRLSGAGDADFEADTLALAEIGRAAGVVPLFRALDHVNHHVRALERFHETHDLLLTPTLAVPPPAVGSMTTPPLLQQAARLAARARIGKVMSRVGIVDQLVEENLGWVPYTQLANMTGRPAISVPLHWTGTGLPLGVQFVGRLGADGDLLALAASLEDAAPWFHRYADISI